METMKLEQLIQATSGLSNRKETLVLVNGQPITEIRITVKDGKPQVNLISTSSAEENNTDLKSARVQGKAA